MVSLRALLWGGFVFLLLSGIGIWVFTDLDERWTAYHLNMLDRVFRNVFPFFFIHLGAAFFVFSLEALVIGWRKSSLYSVLHPNKSTVNDIFGFLVNTLQIDHVVVFLLTLGVMHKLKHGLDAAIGLDEGFLAFIPFVPLQVFLYVLLVDAVISIEHLLHHKLSFLWPFHSFHHSASEMNVITANRGHPVQTELTNTIIALVPLMLIGVPLVPLLIYRVLRNTLAFIHHSRLPWSWGWAGKYLFVSPGYHRIHHSALLVHFNKNLAVLFPVWDHLFGTYYKGSVEPQELGLPDNPYNKKTFFSDMLVPFRRFRTLSGLVEEQKGINLKVDLAAFGEPESVDLTSHFETDSSI